MTPLGNGDPGPPDFESTGGSSIKTHCHTFAETFLDKVAAHPRPRVRLRFHSSFDDYARELERRLGRPIHCVRTEDGLCVHVCEENLNAASLLPLQGWLDLEMAGFVLEERGTFNDFNFSKQILPLFPVSGSALNLFRHLVEYILESIRLDLSTRLVIQLGNGIPLLYAHAMDFQPHADDREAYRMASGNAWIKAVFLCRKFGEVTPLATLSEHNIGFANDLLALWWNRHDYLFEEDRLLVRDLYKTLREGSDLAFRQAAVALFKRVRSYLTGFSL